MKADKHIKQTLAECLIGETLDETRFWRERARLRRRKRIDAALRWMVCGVPTLVVFGLVAMIMWSACNGGGQ